MIRMAIQTTADVTGEGGRERHGRALAAGLAGNIDDGCCDRESRGNCGGKQRAICGESDCAASGGGRISRAATANLPSSDGDSQGGVGGWGRGALTTACLIAALRERVAMMTTRD